MSGFGDFDPEDAYHPHDPPLSRLHNLDRRWRRLLIKVVARDGFDADDLGYMERFGDDLKRLVDDL